MALRTFIPGLLLVARTMCRYIEKNRAGLERNMNPAQLAGMEAVYNACQTLEALIGIIAVAP